MKEPTSFTFHRSYAELIWRIKDPVKEGLFIETLRRYAFQHVVPAEDDPNFNYFILIRPIIDKGMERAESGSRGGKAAKHRKGSLEASFGTDESEKDKEKDKEQEEDKDMESVFAEFWSAYPRKDAKKSARKVFLRILNDADDPRAFLAKILDAITLAKRSHQWQKDNGDFIPLPATWLNQERWEDSGVSETFEEPSDEDRNQKLTNFADTLLNESMSQSIAKTIEATLEAHPTLAERLQRMEEAYASIPEEKREFYKFVFWMLVTLHDIGTHTSASSIATIQARKQLTYCAHEQLAHFCTVLGFPKRNLAKLAEHIDKFIAWFRNHGIEVPKEDAPTLLSYITKAEKQYAALAAKEEELKGTTGRDAATSKSSQKRQKKIGFATFIQSERQSLWEKRPGTSSGTSSTASMSHRPRRSSSSPSPTSALMTFRSAIHDNDTSAARHTSA